MYDQDRSANEAAHKFVAGFKGQLPLDHKTDSVRETMHTGYVEGQDMHHVVGLDQVGPLLQGRPEQEQRLIVNALNAAGVRVGHDGRNLVSQDTETQHGYREKRPGNTHTQLSHLGLEDRTFSGQELINNQNFKNNLTGLSTQSIIQEVVPVFAKYIAEPSMAISRQHNPNVSTIEQNKKLYAQELKDEYVSELAAHKREQRESQNAAIEKKVGTNVQKKLNYLLGR